MAGVDDVARQVRQMLGEPEPLDKGVLLGELRALWDHPPNFNEPLTCDHREWLGRGAALMA